MELSAHLTKREYQIAEMIAWGLTKKDVANKLFISVRTVENTLKSVYNKTCVTKVNELSAWYFCSKFNISLNMSPVARKVVAIILLSLILASELCQKSSITILTRRIETAMGRGRVNRRTDENNYHAKF